ncbi:MAG: hypothetical protein WEA99_12395 [Brumimicrobium sp.]
MKFILFLLFVSAFSPAFSQEKKWWEKGSENETKTDDTTAIENKSDSVVEQPVGPGEINIIKDKRVDKLIEFKSTTIPPASEPQIDGFRVQLFFDQSKTEVNEARAKALKIDSDFDTYIEFDAPNYNLLLGNYRTQLEAEKIRAELSEEFPAAIIVKSRIYFPEVRDTSKTR